MPRYVFDPARLRRREDPYLAVDRMLRDHLGGGDVFAEVRRRGREDSKFHALLDDLRMASEEAVDAIADELHERP